MRLEQTFLRSLTLLLALVTSSIPIGTAQADEAAAPRPTPVTRPAMKQLLEGMKTRRERIPLPEPSAAEIRAAETDPTVLSYENRLRSLYLPGTELRGYLGFGGTAPKRPNAPAPKVVIEPDPAVTLDYGFKTRLFWIASRVNNCQYCLGHQESKLLAVGMTDDDLAHLDTDWSVFPEREQAAFAFARRLTLDPGSLKDADIDRCLEHFTGEEVLEMALSVAGNNAINRWKEGIGVPQAGNGGNSGWAQTGVTGAHSYLTPTAEKFKSLASAVAILTPDDAAQELVATEASTELLSLAEMARGIDAARARTPRLPLIDEAAARTLLGNLTTEGPLPAWMRLLANYPLAGPRMVKAFELTAAAAELTPIEQAHIHWTVARRNRAWYGLALAESEMRALGATAADLADLAGDQSGLSAAERAVLAVADALAASPVVCTDAQFQEALDATSPATLVSVVHEVAMQSLFDRFTEAAALTAP